MAEPQQPPSVRIDPLKYLNSLPEFSGDYRDLQTFINLVDRVHPILLAYDNPSQLLFSDIIKSRLKGKAREIMEINCHATSWADIKNILSNNFGERSSIEELFDKLKGVVFKINPVEFYNDLKHKLRSLNNKTLTTIGPGEATNIMVRNNMNSALSIFKEKMPEPMRTILVCRNPSTLEEAMDILFQSGYAYTTCNKSFESSNRSSPKPFKDGQTHKPRQQNYPLHNNFNNYGPQQQNYLPYYNNHNRPQQNLPSNISNHFNRRLPQQISTGRFNYPNQYPRNNFQNNGNQNYQSRSFNPTFRQNNNPQYNTNRIQPPPEPMDINMIENQFNQMHEPYENQYYKAQYAQNCQINKTHHTQNTFNSCPEQINSLTPSQNNQNPQNPQNFHIQASQVNYPI